MKKRRFGALVAFAVSFGANAGASQGKITTPLSDYQDMFIFSAGTHTNPPDCLRTQLGTWAVDLTTEHGKSMQSLVLTAYAMDKKVKVVGRTVCDVKGDRESVKYLYIVD